MADVTVKYKGSTITEMSAKGTKTLKTSGKYCEGDIDVSYVLPFVAESTGFLSLTAIDVTIGANTVSLGDAAIDYLNELADNRLCAAALLDNPVTQNQLVMIPGAMANPKYVGTTSTATYRYYRLAYRYRTDGTCEAQTLNKDYAFVLKQGSKYRFWVCDVNTTNLKPY